MSKKDLAAELDNILKELTDDDLAKMSSEEIVALKQKINPYGRIIEGSDKYLNFSLTQISHEYWKKLITTAMVGFLNRMLDEWKVPEGVPVVPVYDYLENPSLVEPPELILKKNDTNAIYDYNFNKDWMKKRVVVKEFLEEMFQFNPDEHVRSSYRPNKKDSTRNLVKTEAGELAVNHLINTDREFRNEELLNQETMTKEEFEKTKTDAKIEAKANSEAKTEANGSVPKFRHLKKVVYVDGKPKVVIKKVPLNNTPEEVKEKIKNNKDPTLKNTVREIIPPHDFSGRFKNYLQENFEDLREAVKDLHCEKPEFELAMIPYAWHDSLEEAEDYKKKHRNEFIAEVFTAHSGKWNLFDCFKSQRESVNFYNDNTIIIEEMIKQIERDEKLGQDLMKNRIKKAKKKNVLQEGPDSEGFKKWRNSNDTLKTMGASHIGDMASDECPEDAVQVDVWKIAKGGIELTKERFFTKAEAPTVAQ
jgi:hypothetical protein